MSNYGLKVTGADNIYQLDSDDVSTFYLGVSHVGSTTSIGGSTGFLAAWDDGDFLFVKPKSNSTSYKDVRFTNYKNVSESALAGGLRFYSHVDYIICKVATNSNFADQTGVDYGIEVKNDSGVYVFTSRKINKGMEIIVIKDENSLAGGGGGNGPPSTGNIIYTAPSGTNLDNIWFGSASGMSYTDGSTFVFGGAYYDYTNNRILFQQWIDLSDGIINGSAYEAFSNGGKILVGELHE
jgi:hypothetical protein